MRYSITEELYEQFRTPIDGLIEVGPEAPQELMDEVQSQSNFFVDDFCARHTRAARLGTGVMPLPGIHDKERFKNGKDRFFLWVSNEYACGWAVIGGAYFHWHPDARGYIFTWVIFQKNERRRGHLTRAWEFFGSRFGDFYSETPVSTAMKRFFSKMRRKRKT